MSKMKTAFLTYLFSRYPLEKAFEVGSRLGFDGIEIWGGRPHAYPLDMTEEKIEDILRMQRQYKLEVSMYGPELCGYQYCLSSQDASVRKETVEYLKLALNIAKKINTPKIQITCGHPGYNTNRRQNFKNIVDGLKDVAEVAEKVQVDVVVEALTMNESNIIISCDDLVELIEDVGSKHIVGMLDTVTPRLHHETISDYFEKLGPNMKYIHFVDNDGRTHHHFPYGDGDIYLEECIRVFRKYNYDGWLSVEINNPELKEPEINIGQAFTKLKKIIEDGSKLPLNKIQ